ncbi:MAG: hypothetical protein DRQ51_01625 [Gammaproteobacteria bacterium]|nr:MAG: hypothetical protein DRQ51_01625 [Gammaproteobacteria bacterium]
MKKIYPYLNLGLNLIISLAGAFVVAGLLEISTTALIVIATILPIVWFFVSSLKKYQDKFWQHSMNLLSLFSILFASIFVFDVVFNIIQTDKIQIDLRFHFSLVLIILCVLINFALIRLFDEKNNKVFNEYLDNFLNGPPLLFSLSIAIILSALLLSLIQSHMLPDFLSFLNSKMLDRGIIPPLCLVLFNWGLLLLLGKLLSLKKQQKSPIKINKTNFNDVVEVIWQQNNNFYQTLKYINWAIPLLGFIGTVLGISLASEGLQKIIAGGDGLSQMGSDLASAIAPLGIAFDTTLIALSLSVVLALLQTLLQKKEEQFFCDLQKQNLQK